MRTLILSIFSLSIAIMARGESNQVYYHDGYTYSNSDMINLLGLKKFLVVDLQVYAGELQRTLDKVELAIEQMDMEVQQMEESRVGRVFSGIKQFSLLRHLHLDWPQWLRFMRKEVASAWQKHAQELRPYLPSKVDFMEACKAIYILIDVYGLSVGDFSRGLINGKQYKSKRFGAMDCFALARHGFERRYFDLAEAWFEAIALTSDNDDINRVLGYSWALVLQLYARNLLNMNKKELALTVLQRVSTLGIDDQSILRQLELLERGDLKPTQGTRQLKMINFEHYVRGCRGLFDPPEGLSCHYDFHTHPLLRLAPFKVEPLSQDPYIAMYHDVIYDSEIEELKDNAFPDMERSKVYTYSDEDSKNTGRTSMSAFQTDHQYRAVTKVNRRVMHMTGFEVLADGSSDELLVLNYATAAQYLTHSDYFGPQYSEYIQRGDRIATVLFYLNDVEQGGKTVFPRLGIFRSPMKGSAVVFYNMNSSLQGDPRTEHGGCPVLVGTKWAATKWIYSAEQMFRWPCVNPK
ncbi:prolyl 4-hydroxylase subunit alpha-1-like isoform X1 [Drosophila miranda]|uniref:prolyl 4-hydroxylase subunit alpha-1-like isoform X1 n=1 Tax=Drosophila miranda TaxID=7229 RepID=UPI0007E84FE2|nr:prolyl 4-hydroxylase subunit alpha-1-like isoform X1 [Drosophila miranda]